MTDEDNVVPVRDPRPARGRVRKYDRIYGIFAVTSMEIHKRWVHTSAPLVLLSSFQARNT